MNRDGEKVWVNHNTNHFYLRRGVDRTPLGAEVKIVECNPGLVTSYGSLKGTIGHGLSNMSGQMIAYSKDPDDLMLFAYEHGWYIDSDAFRQLTA